MKRIYPIFIFLIMNLDLKASITREEEIFTSTNHNEATVGRTFRLATPSQNLTLVKNAPLKEFILLNEENVKNISPYSKSTTLLLCIFLGAFGIHRFYVGKPFTGALQFVTAGGSGIWYVCDIIRIALDSFTDGEGRLIIKN
jgi:hypothetical protein